MNFWNCLVLKTPMMYDLFQLPPVILKTHESAGQALTDIISAAATASVPSPILLLLQTDEVAGIAFDLLIDKKVCTTFPLIS